LAKRSVFVIDRDGVVRYRWVTDDALELPDLTEAVTVLRDLGDGAQGSQPLQAADDVSCTIQ